MKEQSDFEKEFLSLRENNISFYDDLLNIGVSIWASSKCRINNYNVNTSNAAETMNSALKRFISLDITNLIIQINNYNMSFFNERRAKQFDFMIFSKQLDRTNLNIESARALNVIASNDELYLVGNNYYVDLALKTCSCNVHLKLDAFAYIYEQF
ncbi:hypothetical protein CDIK_3845 [Cucumispora dikerogammari]|nr:hypothetical protein CDIK_3845 [Cucumispora dikerogammari]